MHKKCNKYITILSGIICCFLVSCIAKTYDIETPEVESKIVINAFFSEGEPIKLNVSSSKPRTSTDGYVAIENANIELYADNVFIETLIFEPSGFNGDSYLKWSYNSKNGIPREGVSYSIKGSADGFNSIYAESVIPANGTIKYVGKEVVKSVERYNNKLRFNLVLENLGKGYYFFAISSYRLDRNQYSLFEMNDPILGVHGQSMNQDFMLFSGDLLPSGPYPFSIDLSDNFYKELWEGKSIYFELKSLSEEAWDYLNSLTELKNLEIISEPLNAYSNIEGGKGIFAGYNSTVDSLVWVDDIDLFQ